MYKICTVVGTRPEIIKLSSVIKLLDQYTNQTIIHTGQHYDYELNKIFFNDLDIREPDFYLNAKGQGAIQTIGNAISKFDELLETTQFDAILIYGDTNSALCAYPAKRRKIPIFHMEAGNRCFDQRVPEEINRKIIDHISDVNMVITEHARRNLIAEGINPEYIFKVGSSMPQVIQENRSKTSIGLKTLSIRPLQYIVLSIHREENIEKIEYIDELVKLIHMLCKDRKVIFSTHPKTRSMLKDHQPKLDKLIEQNKLVLSKPFGFVDYLELQKYSYCTISDSGTIMEESSLLGFPAITIRDSFERPEGMDEGTMIVSCWEAETILDAVNICVKTSGKRVPVEDYLGNDVAQKVLKIIHSMIDKVNRKIYYKN